MSQPEQTQLQPLSMADVAFGIARPEQIAGLDGLAQLRGILTGDLPAPPFAQTTRQWISRADPGEVEFRGDPQGSFLNPMGLVHGGWTMTLLDSALGCSVHSSLKAGEMYVSLGTETKFIKPLTPTSGQVVCLAKVVTRGRRTATAEARVTDLAGTVIATGTTTCFISNMEGK